MYQYLGNERLQLWFYSPNVCVAFLIMSVMLTIGIFFLIVQRKNKWCRILSWSLSAVIFLQFSMITATYSRGGYLACLVVLAITSICSRKRWSVAFLLMFVFTILIIGDGPARVKSMGEIGEGSIRNRLFLWEGGAGIIADNWLGGVGAPPAAGNYYSQWYQPVWLDESYYTLISDYLTLAASYGIFPLFLLLVVLFFLFQQGYKIWRKNHDMMLLYGLGAVAGYMICAAFSTCYRFLDLTWLLIGMALIVVGYIVYDVVKYKERNYHDLWYAPALAAMVCLGIVGYGKYVNNQIPYTKNWRTVNVENDKFSLLEIQPKCDSQGTIIFLTPSLEGDIRKYLRPIVDSGYKVIAAKLNLGFPGLKSGIRLLPAIYPHDSKVYLMGAGSERALLAVAVAANLPNWKWAGVIVENLPYEWPFDELSPKLLVPKLKVPLIMIQDKAYMNDGEFLKRICENHNIAVYLNKAQKEKYYNIEQYLRERKLMSDITIPSLTYEQMLEDYEHLVNFLAENIPDVERNKHVFGQKYLELADKYRRKITPNTDKMDFYEIINNFLTALNGNHLWLNDQLFYFFSGFDASKNDHKIIMSYYEKLVDLKDIAQNHLFHLKWQEKNKTSGIIPHIPLTYYNGDYYNVYGFNVAEEVYPSGMKLNKINDQLTDDLIKEIRDHLDLYDVNKNKFYGNLKRRVFDDFYYYLPETKKPFHQYEFMNSSGETINFELTDGKKLQLENMPGNPVYKFPKQVKYLEDFHILYIRLPVMNNADIPFYLDSIEREAAGKIIEYAVIDIRYNYGGNDFVWHSIIEKLIPEKLTYKIYHALKNSEKIRDYIKNYSEFCNELNSINNEYMKLDIKPATNISTSFLAENYMIMEECKEFVPMNSIKLNGPIFILTHDIYSSAGNFTAMAESFEQFITVGLNSPVSLGNGMEPICESLPNSKLIFTANVSLDITNSNNYTDTLHHRVKEEINLTLSEKIKYLKDDIGDTPEKNIMWLVKEDPFFREILHCIKIEKEKYSKGKKMD